MLGSETGGKCIMNIHGYSDNETITHKQFRHRYKYSIIIHVFIGSFSSDSNAECPSEHIEVTKILFFFLSNILKHNVPRHNKVTVS